MECRWHKDLSCLPESGLSIIYQDNQSDILLENNGHWSQGQQTKHINVRYSFIKDRINAFLLKEEKPDENNEREETLKGKYTFNHPSEIFVHFLAPVSSVPNIDDSTGYFR